MEQLPVTFALFAYNQERFIRKAVEAALAQDYPRLEIILSDDCSKDNTFEIMEQIAKGYRGNNKIFLNRNQENLGIGSHVNKVLKMANGELIVLAAGDDISNSNRTSELVNHWIANDKKYDAIWSAVTLIDETENIIGELRSPVSCSTFESQVQQMVPCLLGCAHATTKRLFDQYGSLRDDVVYEDRAFAFRALCAGGLSYIDKELVQYRIHRRNVSYNLTSKNNDESLGYRLINQRLHLDRQCIVSDGYKDDLKKITRKMVDGHTSNQIERIVLNLQGEMLTESLIYSDSFAQRLKGLYRSFFNFRISARRRIRYLISVIDPRLSLYDYGRLRIWKKNKPLQRYAPEIEEA